MENITNVLSEKNINHLHKMADCESKSERKLCVSEKKWESPFTEAGTLGWTMFKTSQNLVLQQTFDQITVF